MATIPKSGRKARSSEYGQLDQRARALPWHQDLVVQFSTRRLAQALMVHGRLGDGLEQLCLALACNALEHNDSQAARLLEVGSHPDLLVLRRELGTTGNLRSEIVIDQARAAIAFAHLTPTRAQFRIIVICPACQLNNNAANCLLRLLEEPPLTARLILGTERPELLPATVRSRLVKTFARRPSQDQAVAWLNSVGRSEVAPMLELADGAPLEALSAMASLAEAHQSFIDLAAGRVDMLTGVKQLIDIAPAIWLPWAMKWTADGAAVTLGLEPRYYRQDDGPRSIAKNGQALPWLNLYRDLQEQSSFTTVALNNRLLLEKVSYAFERLQP